jgi:molybdopterin molybdotransferase
MAVVSFPEARRIVEGQARTLRPRGFERVMLREAFGRVLGEPLVADRDLPPFARATRDGYAVRSADVARIPARLKVAGEIRAGSAPDPLADVIHPGQTAAIMTGAPLPPGADAVVMVEFTSREGDVATIEQAVTAGEHVVPQGAEARVGEWLLEPGSRVGAAAIAVAASVGQLELLVCRRPQVAILATGDELVDAGERPGPAQIRNSTSVSLAAQVSAAGACPHVLPIARDDPACLLDSIRAGLKADLLILSGGVSVGKYDLVEQALAELHAEFFFTGALIQPGKPAVFGRCPRDDEEKGEHTFFLGLPGNPVSTLVTFELFAWPLLSALAGAAEEPLRLLGARLKSALRLKPGLTRFLPAQLSGEFGQVEVTPVNWQGSGDVVAAARADCYLVAPPERDRLDAGEAVSVLLMHGSL